MPRPRVLVLRAPGTNCDQEAAFAFNAAGGQAELLHVNRLLESPNQLNQFQILCLPGGFSYGDDLAAGRVLAVQVQHFLRDAVENFKAREGLIWGICNGFQVLIRTGALLEPTAEGAQATLTWNNSGRFEDRWVHLEANAQRCVLLRGIYRMYLPVAHAEGKFVPRDRETLARLEAGGQIVLRYATAEGDRASQQYPANPNGSVDDIAGICDSTGRVLGLMPHPERFIDRLQHPRWTRESLADEGDGLEMFRNAIEYFD